MVTTVFFCLGKSNQKRYRLQLSKAVLSALHLVFLRECAFINYSMSYLFLVSWVIYVKIAICGSISMCNEIVRVKKELEDKGHSVGIPEGCKNPDLIGREKSNSEKIEDKIKYDLIRKHSRRKTR